MAGYWGEEEKTREVIDAAGWMHTGDIAEMDQEGFIKIKGRIKDVVIRGGENLFQKRLKTFIYSSRRKRCTGDWLARCEIWRRTLCMYYPA